MDVLVLGGTGFIGRHVVEVCCARGHRVSVLARRPPPQAVLADAEPLRGDRDTGGAGLAALAGCRWDAVVDLSGYLPRQLQPVLDRLAPTVGRYVFVSAVMVYGDVRQGPIDESHPRVAPAAPDVAVVDGSSYGPVLAPGDGSDHLQFIDVRDLADFVAQVLHDDLAGSFNLDGPRLRWADFIHLLGLAQPVWVPAARLQAAGLGFRELPLFRPTGGLHSGLMHVSSARAQAAGLRLHDVAQTLRAAAAEVPPLVDMAWLSAASEAALMARAAGPG